MQIDNENLVVAEISALAFGGAGIGTVKEGLSSQIGKKIFVASTIPGELIDAHIITEKPRYLEGELIQIITPSDDRQPAPCPVFSLCGGCTLQHIKGTAQRNHKFLMLLQMLEKQHGLELSCPTRIIGNDLPFYGYRRRITLHVDRTGQIGFYRQGSGEVVAINHCLLASALINQSLATLLELPREELAALSGIVLEEHNNSCYVALKMREESQLSTARKGLFTTLRELLPNFEIIKKHKTIYQQQQFKESKDDSLPIGHFSQVNPAGNSLLVKTVVEKIKGDSITDLYAGSGNFSIPLAQTGKLVTAVEIDQKLVSYGEQLAEQQGVGKTVRFIRSSAERYLKSCKIVGTLLIDPPRCGAKFVTDRITPDSVEQLIYVSCNLPTLMRDLKQLLAKGFKLQELLMLDMFPQTTYVETVVVMTGR